MKKVVISRRNEGWALRDLNPRPPACRTSPEGARGVTRSTGKSHRSRRYGPLRGGAGLAVFGVVSALMLNGSWMTPDAGWGSPKPCAAHEGAAKKACVKQHKRDQMTWPPNPTAGDIKKRVGAYNWQTAERIAVCETGKKLRWYLGPNGEIQGSYVSAMGMYSRTFQWGRSRTPYLGRTWPEQVAIAVAAHPITRGWSGWSCF